MPISHTEGYFENPKYRFLEESMKHANLSMGGLFWKSLVLLFRRIYALSDGFKMKRKL